jgi:hypothetical protein
MELSKFSKHLLFLSLQIYQEMQIDTIFQIATLFGLPDFYQQASKSITLLGITQDKPNRVKRAFHKAEAILQ